MRKTFSHAIGGVLSADIAVPNHQAELDFYSSILTTGEAPLWRNDLMNNNGSPVIGLGARVPEYEMLPLQWMPHFQVADIAGSVANAVDLGGEVLMHSKTDDGQSQWAVLTDQAGAAFGLIPVVDPSEAPLQHKRFGSIAWLSLTVTDVAQSQEFYQQVVGWSAKPMGQKSDEGLFTNYEMQIAGEFSAAEICQHHSENRPLPAVWLIHLPVDDYADSLRRVSQGGGEILWECVEPQCAVVRDPVGVHFALQPGS